MGWKDCNQIEKLQKLEEEKLVPTLDNIFIVWWGQIARFETIPLFTVLYHIKHWSGVVDV